MDRRGFLLLTGGLATVGAGAGYGAVREAGERYGAYCAALRAPLRPDGGIAEMIRFATLAPNGHNAQPWRCFSAGRTIRLAPDLSRRTPVVDPDDHHLFVSLGAAAECLAVAGRAAGRPGDVTIGGDGAIAYDWSPSAPLNDRHVDAVRLRKSVRTPYDGRPVDPSDLAALAAAGREDGVRLVLVTDATRRAAVTDLVVEGNGRQMADPAFMAELKSWIRFSPASALRHGDGLYGPAVGSPPVPDALGRLVFDLAVRPEEEGRRCRAALASTPALAVFLADAADPAHWARIGRAAMRLLLEATRRGLVAAFVNQPVEVEALRAPLASLVGEAGVRPDLVVRLGYGVPPAASPRRPVSAVLSA